LHWIPQAPLHVAIPLCGAGQVPHAAPPLPHRPVDCAVGGTQPAEPQQPFGHVVALQATQAPLEQIMPVPHDCPSLMLLPAVHEYPPLHAIVPLLHELPFGVHAPPWLQATQVLWPSHTPLAPPAVMHAAPAAAGVVCSVHVATPLVHDVVP
jgi:hypothetical protein